jgi:hypothetical protein
MSPSSLGKLVLPAICAFACAVEVKSREHPENIDYGAIRLSLGAASGTMILPAQSAQLSEPVYL